MSKYQYYEWQTLERPLTAAEQSAVNGLSIQIDVTASQAIVTYNWGDFKHDPIHVLAKYVDAHLYMCSSEHQCLRGRVLRGRVWLQATLPPATGGRFCDRGRRDFSRRGIGSIRLR